MPNPKPGEEICSCGHGKETHRSEAMGDITYCRRCNCDNFVPTYKMVPIK